MREGTTDYLIPFSNERAVGVALEEPSFKAIKLCVLT